MNIIRGLHNLRAEHRPCVATIGNFDGVHLGHQAVLRQLRTCAQETGVPSAVMVFEPQPQEFFRPDKAPARLMRLRDKYDQLCAFGVDRVFILRFNQQLASMTAEDFIVQILVGGLGVQRLVVGDDFRFGKGRRGDYVMLESAGREFGFGLERARTYAIDGARVSSTLLRDALARGDLAGAKRLLGHPYSVAGRVIEGRREGRRLGFPTINLALHPRSPLLGGIYAVRVIGAASSAQTEYDGVAYVSERPNGAAPKRLLEVHIFNFDEDCYGRRVRVDLHAYLREGRRFDSEAELRQQIAADASQARALLQG